MIAASEMQASGEKAASAKIENDHISVDMDVTEFDSGMCGIESTDEISKKLIGYIERMVRGSYEYKQYINYLRTELDINSCSLLKGINAKDLGVSLEMHHYPLTLFEIVQVILTKDIMSKPLNGSVSMFDVMQEVMREHYAGDIGLVPLTTTMHEMAHAGSVKIPYSKVYGNIDGFVLKYSQWMPDDIKEKVTNAKAIFDEDAKDANADKLKKGILDYNIKYAKPTNETKTDSEESQDSDI
jgi:hypothetical protein